MSPEKSSVCEEVWETIVERNNKENGNFGFLNYKNTLERYYELSREYQLVKACLLKLSIRCSYKVIDILEEKGYKISKRRKEYFKSIEAASRRADNLITKIESKKKQLSSYASEEQPLTYQQSIARVSGLLKYALPNDVTLAYFNESKKLAKEQNKSKDGGNRSGRYNRR